eukprot:m51a1_g11747 hypothetical protein (241) ;mRNA; r:164054-164893
MMVGLLSVVLSLLQRFLGDGAHLSINGAFHTYVGMSLSLLLVFRTNTCYEQVCAFIPEGEFSPARSRIQQLAVAFAFAVRNNLRMWDSLVSLEDVLSPEDMRFVRLHTAESKEPEHSKEAGTVHQSPLPLLPLVSHHPHAFINQPIQSAPALLILMLNSLVVRLHDYGVFSHKHMLKVLLLEITGLSDAWGGLQRIRSMPTPFAYAHHIKLFVHLYCFTIPFAMLSTMGIYARKNRSAAR